MSTGQLLRLVGEKVADERCSRISIQVIDRQIFCSGAAPDLEWNSWGVDMKGMMSGDQPVKLQLSLENNFEC